MQETTFIITEAADWPMLRQTVGLGWLIINGVLFVLLGIIYRGLPKKADLFILQQNMQESQQQAQNEMRSSMSLVADRFERALEKHHEQTETLRDKELERLRNDFKEWREWHNENCPVGKTGKAWIARHVQSGEVR